MLIDKLNRCYKYDTAAVAGNILKQYKKHKIKHFYINNHRNLQCIIQIKNIANYGSFYFIPSMWAKV